MTERQQKAQEGELFRLLAENVKDYAIFVIDLQGRVQSWNPGAERLLGYQEAEIIGQSAEVFFTPEDVRSGVPQREMKEAVEEGRGNDDRWHVRKDGSRFWAGGMMTPLWDDGHKLRGFAKIMRDRTEWKLREVAAEEHERIATFNKDVGLALIQTDTLPGMLRHCAEAMVRHLNGAFARIWTLNAAENVLELRASVGQYTHLDGPHSRIPVGQFKIGLIAQERKPHLTNAVVGDPRVNNQEWANQEGMIAFAGYPLLVDDRLVGVMAMFARQSLSDATLEAMASVANGIASGVERKQGEERLREQQEWLRVTLASIGDAVIATDTGGRVTFLNPVAQGLTGWTLDNAQNQPLEKVFEIWNEQTRQPVENPVAKVLRDGVIVGLGNHTVLIAKNGAERPIDDSAAPIRNAAGEMIGVVLIFRDVTEQRRAEREVRQSEARKSAILETALDCIITMDHEGNVVEFNPAAEKTFGYRRAQVIGQELSNLIIPPSLRDRHRIGMAHYLTTGEGPVLGKRIELPALRADGTELTVELAINRISTDGPPLFTAYLRDISERNRTEAALLEAHRELENRVTDRTAELVQANEFLKALLENVQTGVVACDSDGVLTLFNGVTRALHGLPEEPIPPEQWAGRYCLYQPDGETPMAKEDVPLYRALQGERVQDAEMVIAPLGVPPRTVLTSGQAFYDAHGKKLGAVASMQDITSRKHAEEALRQSHDELERRVEERTGELAGANAALREGEERFRQLADSMPQIVWTARPDGNIDYLNRQWHEFTGLAESAGNDGWGQLLHPHEAPSASERWAASVRSGAPFEMEMRLLDRRRQAYRWHLIRTVAVHDESGRVARWFGTGTDIDGQKRAEEGSRYLAEASAALAGVVDYESTLQKVANLAVPYFADWSAVDVADDGRGLRRLAVAHQDADKIALAHELMREYPPDPQAPGGVFAVLRTGKPELVGEITDAMLVQGARDEKHLHLIRSLGLKSFICVPLIVSGRPLGVLTFATAESGRTYTDADLALATDLAHRAAVAVENTRLYQALRDADRRKDEFLATLAHELRNPLAPIRNALQILKMPRVDAETVGRSRDIMERQVEHLVRLVDDLLDVSRVMRGKIELRRERVELAAVVARAVETVQPLIDAQGHLLSVRLPPQSLPIDADPVRLAQVVGNLLTNAAKYAEPGGRIWLTAERSGDVAGLRVRDTGIGIDPAMLPRIFELFVQVDHASTKAQGGLGIGLTLVKNLVEMHNGTVEARSEGLGKGSEFVVRLPISALGTDSDRGAGTGTQADEPPSPSGFRLLVVDDNQDAANSLAMLLKLQGHEVRVAYGGVAALETTKTFTPDVVFMDIGMPGMDGYEVARRLRQQPGLERVVLAALTGWGQKEDRRRTSEAGFDHHLVKPPEPKAIEGVLAESKRSDAK